MLPIIEVVYAIIASVCIFDAILVNDFIKESNHFVDVFTRDRNSNVDVIFGISDPRPTES